MMIIIICTSCTSIDRKEKRKKNTYFFLLVLQFMMTPIVHCTSSFACLKRMRWNERIYAREKERERERERVQLSHTYKRPSSVCLSRHISYRRSKGKRGKTFFLSLSYSSLLLNVSLVVSHSFNHQSCRRCAYVAHYFNLFWLF